MATLYVPRGYVSTVTAITQLFKARHPDLVAGKQERTREVNRLYAMKSASKPSPITPLNARGANSDRVHPEFTRADEQRLTELATIENRATKFWDAGANDIRSALAEGDFPAIHQTRNGQQAPIAAERWRAVDGLEAVSTGQIKIVPTFGMSGREGQALIKEIDLITWLSVQAPKPFSHVPVSVTVQDHKSLPQKACNVLPPPSLPEASSDVLPLWLTPMEAIAWIVSRHAKVVGYAAPKANAIRSYVIDHVLPNGKRISGEVELPAGMSLLWLDLFAASDPNETMSTENALTELLAALAAGQVIARAIWVATGERLDMGTDEWRTLVFDTPPRNERLLLPYRIVTGPLAKQPENRWREILLPRGKVLEIWPAVDVDFKLDQSGTRPVRTSSQLSKTMHSTITEDDDAPTSVASLHQPDYSSGRAQANVERTFRIVELCQMWAQATGKRPDEMAEQFVQDFFSGVFEKNGLVETLAESENERVAGQNLRPITVDIMMLHIGASLKAEGLDRESAATRTARDWQRMAERGELILRPILGLRLTRGSFLDWYRNAHLLEKPAIWSDPPGTMEPIDSVLYVDQVRSVAHVDDDSDTAPSDTTRTTAAGERALERWLISEMKASPDIPTRKEDMKIRAKAKKLAFSDRGFARSWANAVNQSGAIEWSRPGRKSKRRIDTRV